MSGRVDRRHVVFSSAAMFRRTVCQMETRGPPAAHPERADNYVRNASPQKQDEHHWRSPARGEAYPQKNNTKRQRGPRTVKKGRERITCFPNASQLYFWETADRGNPLFYW